ncbi:uncharacterized protein LOC135121369 isoform X2 [Zophobas morio]|uniref:uncharacterized protein LOC135121369 isoform X2 n=1 Tax=Zophobas morio TaxID=2755281 RepID=UPI003083AE94
MCKTLKAFSVRALRAIFFDLDGTLVNTDVLHYEIFSSLLKKKYDKKLTVEDYKKDISGKHNKDIVSFILPDVDKEEAKSFIELKESLFRNKLDKLQPLPGLKLFLEAARNKNIAMACVTNAPRKNAETLLQILTVADYFDLLVIGDELKFAKPHPLPYLSALSHFQLEAEEALVFEDSPSGIKAAIAAQITTIGVATSLDEALMKLGVSFAIKDYTDFRLYKLLE